MIYHYRTLLLTFLIFFQIDMNANNSVPITKTLIDLIRKNVKEKWDIGCGLTVATLIGCVITYKASKKLQRQHNEFDKICKLLEQMGAKITVCSENKIRAIEPQVRVEWDKKHPDNKIIQKYVDDLEKLRWNFEVKNWRYVCFILTSLLGVLSAANLITTNFEPEYADLIMGGALTAASITGCCVTYKSLQQWIHQSHEFTRIRKILEQMGAKVVMWSEQRVHEVEHHVRVEWDRKSPKNQELEKYAQNLIYLFNNDWVTGQVFGWNFALTVTIGALAYGFLNRIYSLQAKRYL